MNRRIFLSFVPAILLLAPSVQGQSGLESVIGYVEIDGIGRLDVHAAPEGSSGADAMQQGFGGYQPTAAWIEGQDRIIIFALRESGTTSQGYVDIDLLLSTDHTGFQDRTKGFNYYDPSAESFPTHGRLRTEALTLEEISRSSDGRWKVIISLDGSAMLDDGNEIPMKGVIHVEGMPSLTL